MPRRKLKQRTPIQPMALIGPGFRGLNTELEAVAGTVDPQWALVLQNAIFDTNGRVGLRNGWVDQTSTPITGTPKVFISHEYPRDNGNVTDIVFTDGFEIHESADSGATWSDITGALSTTTVKGKFQVFNDRLYWTAPGHKVWEYSGTGTFTQVASSPVTNGTLLAAFGRLWAGQDASSSIKHSVLLDGGDWSGSGSGSIDASNAWTSETDTVTALAAFGSTFVVFGRKQILLYVDGTGSILGIDPTQMYVVDTIEGTGVRFRDSVINIGEGDLWFISDQGVQSLARAVTEKINPLVDVTANVRSLVQQLNTTEIGATGEVKGIFSAENGFVLYLFQESDKILMLDTKLPLGDGTYRAAEWIELTDFYSMSRRKNGDIMFGLGAGNLAKYTGFRDDGGGADTKYDLVYASPWIDGGPDIHNRLKILKQIYAVFFGRETITATARWAFDFRPLEFSETFTNDFVASGGEFGAGEFGEDEFDAGHRFRRQYIAGAGEGQYVKVWITLESTDVDATVSLQELGIMVKIGRTQ